MIVVHLEKLDVPGFAGRSESAAVLGLDDIVPRAVDEEHAGAAR